MIPRIVFFGTPSFAAELFRYLHAHHVPIAGVVTRPDRPKGRSLQVRPSAVKEALLQCAPETPLFQPLKARDPEFLQSLKSLGADLFVVVAYGQIFSETLLAMPPLGCINVHASLLPKYRGAAPIQRCLMAGEKESGVAIQKMVKELDAGDVIALSKLSIPPEMNAQELEEALCELSKPLLLSVLKQYAQGIPSATAQDHSLASYAPKIELEEGELHWDRPAETLHNLVRAFSPRPGAWCWVQKGEEKRRLKILRTRVLERQGTPGKIFFPQAVVACKDHSLELLQVQPEGKKVMSGSDWLRGLQGVGNFSLVLC